MKRFTVLTATLATGAVLAPPASAEIVKTPTGASSKIKLNGTTAKALKKHRVGVSSTGSATKAGTTLSLPYSLSRWDFAAREGDVVHFKSQTGFRLKRAGGKSIVMVHPRVVVDGRNGYITALISNIRVKTFTFDMGSGKVTETAGLQRISGLRLKLTKASAVYLNAGLKRKALRAYSQFGTLELNILKPAASPQSGGGGTGGGNGSGGGTNPTVTAPTPINAAPGQASTRGGTLTTSSGFAGAVPTNGLIAPVAPGVTVDANGDGQPDAGVFGLPLKSSTFSATTRTGTIALDGGLIVRANGQDVVKVDDPEIVVGTTSSTSGLFALVNGVRVRIGDIDPSTLNVNVLGGTVTVSDLDVRVSTLGATLPGLSALVPGSPLLTLDLSIPS